MTEERLGEIRRNWIGSDGKGLAIVGNESYRQVAELIEALEASSGTGVAELEET